MKKYKSPKLKYSKETPEARYRRVSSGAKFRAVVFEDKRRKLQKRAIESERRLRKNVEDYTICE